MIFTVGEKIIGLQNNGYANASSDAMLNVDRVDEEKGLIDATVVATHSFSSGKWTKKSSTTLYYGLNPIKFRSAFPNEVNEAFPPKVSKAKITSTINFGGGFKVSFREDGTIDSNFNLTKQMIREVVQNRIDAIQELVNTKKKEGDNFSFLTEIGKAQYECINAMFNKEELEKTLDNFIKFFKEFEFTPSLRFINTLSRKCCESGASGMDYINNYFKLCDNPHKEEVIEKITCAEFKQMLNQMGIFAPTKKVNDRLIVWYGAPGTGKTYKATHLTDGRCIVCNSGLLPNDLLEDFDFVDGKPVYKQSLLTYCMENGLPITLDEGNLLNQDTVRFLQGITDGKETFNYKDKVIHVKEGFKIYMTMNLVVNGLTFGLTEPLVDRAEDIQEFTLTGKDLMFALE